MEEQHRGNLNGIPFVMGELWKSLNCPQCSLALFLLFKLLL